MDIEENFKRHLFILGTRKAYCIFGGQQEWDENRKVYSIPPNSPRKITEWVEKASLVEQLRKYIDIGWIVWISLNEKEIANDTIEGVQRIHAFWFDFDSERQDKSQPATEEEKEISLKEAEGFRAVMEDMDMRGFIACSGNGYHVYFPVHPYDLRGGSVVRREFNEKQRAFYHRLREKGNFKFDTTTDIRRLVQPIGFPNIKIPDHPIETYWIDDFGLEDVQAAREKNEKMIEGLLSTEIRKSTISVLSPEKSSKKTFERFNKLVEEDNRLKALYEGNIELTYDKNVEKYKEIREKTGKLIYTSRSEAEESLVTKLCQKGFTDSEIKNIMTGCGIGKWQEKGTSYHDITIIKARKFAEEHGGEEKRRGRPPKKSERKAQYMSIILQDLMNRYTFVTPDDTKDIHVYDRGIYKPGDVLVEFEVEDILGDEADITFTEEVIGHIRRRTYVPRKKFNSNRSFLPVKNGLLNLDTCELEEFDSNKIFTYQLPVDFDPNASAPNIGEFIRSVISPKDIPVVQEYIGYCLYPDMPAHKSLWLYGFGRNGKTTFVNLVRALIGDDSTTSVTLDELTASHRFSKARLYGKLLNVVSEPTLKEIQTVDFKKLVGADLVCAEMKNKQKTLDFVNFAKFIIFGNSFPSVDDPSIAFWDRLIVINFPNVFLESAVPNYDRVLIEQDGLSGFLNWCLEGLKRLKAHAFQFTQSKGSESTMREFLRQSNSVRSFMAERCELIPSAYATKEDLYEQYKDYCDRDGLKVRGKKEFSQIIGETPRVHSKNKLVDGKVHRCWFGIKCKPGLEEEEDMTLQQELNEDEATEYYTCEGCSASFRDSIELNKHRATCPDFQVIQAGWAKMKKKWSSGYE